MLIHKLANACDPNTPRVEVEQCLFRLQSIHFDDTVSAYVLRRYDEPTERSVPRLGCRFPVAPAHSSQIMYAGNLKRQRDCYVESFHQWSPVKKRARFALKRSTISKSDGPT